MFGHRPDGKRVKNADPIVSFTPYLMPMRCDSQVFLSYDADFLVLMEYAARKSREGFKVTFMEILIAAFVRSIGEVPEANCFIMNKQLFARKELSVSMTVLAKKSDGSPTENLVKVCFDPTDTLYEVVARVQKAVEDAKNIAEGSDSSIRVAGKLLSIPGLTTLVVGLARFADRYGILPRPVMDLLPFYSSLFITNLASIGLTKAYHHLYNWGDVSMFISMGNSRRTYVVDASGKPHRKATLPLGYVVDERVCAGAVYARLFAAFKKYLANPSLLETPPEKVLFNEGVEIHMPKPEGVYVPAAAKNDGQ